VAKAGQMDVPLLRRLVGQALRRRRLAQGRTLRDVADAARVSMPYLSEIERGLKEASSEVLAAICRALHVRLADLLDEIRQELAQVEPEIVPTVAPGPAPAPGVSVPSLRAEATSDGPSVSIAVPGSPRAAAGFLGVPRRRVSDADAVPVSPLTSDGAPQFITLTGEHAGTAAWIGSTAPAGQSLGRIAVEPARGGAMAGGAMAGGAMAGGAMAGGAMAGGAMLGGMAVGTVRVLAASPNLGRSPRYDAVLGTGRVVVPAGRLPRAGGIAAGRRWSGRRLPSRAARPQIVGGGPSGSTRNTTRVAGSGSATRW
jgi:transcriptional regulator with XRE-family HTH domain